MRRDPFTRNGHWIQALIGGTPIGIRAFSGSYTWIQRS